MIFNSTISKIENGADLSDATATASDILSGKTAYVASGKVLGTLNRGDIQIPLYLSSISIKNNSTASIYFTYTTYNSTYNTFMDFIDISSNETKTVIVSPGIWYVNKMYFSSTDDLFFLNAATSSNNKVLSIGSGIFANTKFAILNGNIYNVQNGTATLTIT